MANTLKHVLNFRVFFGKYLWVTYLMLHKLYVYKTLTASVLGNPSTLLKINLQVDTYCLNFKKKNRKTIVVIRLDGFFSIIKFLRIGKDSRTF